MSLYNAILKQSIILDGILVKTRKKNEKGVLIKAAYCPDTVHEILNSFIAPFICYMCEILHDQCEYF